MSLLKLKPRPAPVDPLADAEAEVEKTRLARDAAREAVDTAVAAFPVGMRDRRAISAMPYYPPADETLAYLRSPEQRAGQDRRRVYEDALKAEGFAKETYDLAVKARDDLRRVAEVAALGDGRAALRVAIQERDEAIKVADAARAFAEKARGNAFAARTRHSHAESLLAEARERAIGSMVGHGGGQPPELRDLRRAVADAADDIDLADEASRRAEGGLGDPEYFERKACEAVEKAADAVIATKASIAWEAVVIARDEVKRTEAVFSAIARRIEYGTALDDVRRRYLELTYHLGDPVTQVTRAQAAAAWNAARAALLNDASAPLPEV